MDIIKKIIRNSWLLAISILLVGYDSIRKIIFPCRHRKGNMLSVLFSFLVEVTGKVLVFEKAILNKSWLQQQGFVKRGLVMAAAFFFLITSFEWTVTKNQPTVSNKVHAVHMHEKVKGSVTVNNQTIATLFTPSQTALTKETIAERVQPYDNPYPIPQKRYLVNRVLLI